MKKIKIGLPCSPAKILSHEKINVRVILASFGGGMGGSTKTYYCTRMFT